PPSAASAPKSAAAPAPGPAKASPKDSPANAGPAAELKLKWPVGNKYTYRMDIAQNSDIKIAQMPNPIKQEVTMGMVNSMTVLKETENGGRQIEFQFLAQEMDMKMGEQSLSFDSKGESANDAQNPIAGPLRKLIGSKLKYLVDAAGKVEKIEGADELIKKLTSGGNAMGTQMMK